MPFQTSVNTALAHAVAGDFADHNPRTSVMAGPGGIVAGASGVTVGRFAWLSPSRIDGDNAPMVANSFGSGPVAGIVGRSFNGLLTTFLAEASMTIPQGFPVTPYNGGGFWVKNEGTTQALKGHKAYADLATGKVTFAATGSASTATSTASTIAAGSASVTGSISDNILTVTNVGSGTLPIGAILSGINVATGTQIVSQITGTAGGVGTYVVSIPEQSAASTTVSATYGTLTIGGTLTGTFVVGGLLSSSSVTAGTYITALGTGAGGAGTYIVNKTQTVSSEAIASTTNVETRYVAFSVGAAGELVKISTHLEG